MPLHYKIDVLETLKDRGYSTYDLRKNKYLSEATIQQLRKDKAISWERIEMICQLLQCQPNYFLLFIVDCNGPQHWIEERERNKRQKTEKA